MSKTLKLIIQIALTIGASIIGNMIVSDDVVERLESKNE